MRLPFRYLFLLLAARRWKLAVVLLLGGAGVSRAQAPAFGPAVVVGAYAGDGQSTVTGTAIDAQGYVYVTGSYHGTAQFGSFTLVSTVTQAYVAKLDGAGNFQWIRTVDGPYFSTGSGLVADAAGKVTIIGSFTETTATFGPFTLNNANATVNTSDVYVAQLDAAGTWLWATQGGGLSYDSASGVSLDAAGNVYVAGSYSSATATFGSTTLTNANPATTSANTYDLFVGKLSPQGSWQWVRSGGGSSHDASRALAVTAGGTVYLTGITRGAAAAFGPFALPGAAGTNDAVLVAQLTTDGTWQWVATGGGGINDDGSSAIVLDAAGSAYVAGSFTSPTATFGATTLANIGYGGGGYGDIFVAKVDAGGRWQWAVRAGGEKNDAATALALDAAGRLVVAGIFGGSTARFGATSLLNTAGGGAGGAFSPSSIFLAYLSPAGTWQGAVASQGGGDEQPVSLAVDAYDNLSLGGSFQGTSLTLGAVTLAGAGSNPITTGFVTLVPQLPVVASLAPGSGAPGQAITVTGTGFVGVTDVLFNGKSAAAFTVQTASRLVATVPAGATAGPVSVRTSAGAANSPVPFQALAPLATSGPASAATATLAWPNPAGVGQAWQVRLAAAPAAATRVEVRSMLGQLVFQTQLGGQALCVPVPRLAPGVYKLTLLPGGQPATQQRVVVVD